MDFLATSTSLGTLEVLEIYIQFNGPRLISCKNQSNKIFLALWVDEEEDVDLWLYVLISIDRLQAIRTGEISLHQAFSKPELDYLYEVIFHYENSEWISREVTLEEIEEDCFPSHDAFLDCDPTTLPQVESQKAIWKALRNQREVVHLVLNDTSDHPNEIPSFELGKLLYRFQPLINQLNAMSAIDLKLKPRDIAAKSEFNVFATSPGSFQVELASSLFESDAFGNSFAGNAVSTLFQLIKIGSDTKQLQNFMSRMEKKTATTYKLFLEALISSGTGIKFEWGSPTLGRGGNIEACLSLVAEVLTAIKKIESLQGREIKITGEVSKIDKDEWKFSIKDIKNGDLYKGDILEQAKNDARIATISMIYSATIIEIPEFSPATNIIRNQYKLSSLSIHNSLEEQINLKFD